MTSAGKYAAFFGRPPDLVLNPSSDDERSPFAYRFPPTDAGFIKRIFTPLHADCVFITEGMSRYEMPVPQDEQSTHPSRIELLACTRGAIIGGEDGRDIVTVLLQSLAVVPFRHALFFAPLQTCDLGERICPNSEMTGFFFAVPDGVEMGRLCRCTPSAELVVSVIPITASEIGYAKDKGSSQLVALFEEAGVPNRFDPFRKGVI